MHLGRLFLTFAFLADVCGMKKKMLRDRISDGGDSKLKKEETRGR
jgi:hypothetical protein